MECSMKSHIPWREMGWAGLFLPVAFGLYMAAYYVMIERPGEFPHKYHYVTREVAGRTRYLEEVYVRPEYRCPDEHVWPVIQFFRVAYEIDAYLRRKVWLASANEMSKE